MVSTFVGCGTPMSPDPQQGSATPDQGSAQSPAAHGPGAANAPFTAPSSTPPEDDAGVPEAAPPPDSGPTCPTSAASCAGATTNLHTDPANCGSCGHACAGGAWCSGGACWTGSQRSAAVSKAQAISDAVDQASKTHLSAVGDEYAFASDDQGVKMRRVAAGATSTMTSPWSPHATFQVSKDVFTDIGSAKTTFDFHVAESISNPFAYVAAPDALVLSHVYAYGLVDVSNPSNPTHLQGLSTSGNGITVTLPCDKATQCAQCPCTCACYAFNAGATTADDAWSTDAIATLSESASSVTCTTYAPEGIVAAFAK